MTNKKLVIPAILAATILVAGMFALMPVQKAQTVHTTIQANTSKMVVASPPACTKSATNNCQSFTVDIAPGENYAILAIEVTVNDAGAGASDTFDLGAIVLAGATTEIDPAPITHNGAGSTLRTTSGTTHGAVAIAGNDITTAAGTTTLDDGDVVTVRAVLLVEGDTTITATALGNL